MVLHLWKKYISPMTSAGVLGMNRRNISYISRYNSRHLFPLVDNKLTTKQMALEAGVRVPELIGVIDSQHAVGRLKDCLGLETGFCIKPSKGSGGKGILVITRVENGVFYKANGQGMLMEDIRRHVSNVLAGLFSLGGAMDVAVVESLIVFDETLQGFSFEGVPDIRVIVFRGIPIMAMMRLSCSGSHGKANLHQGAIGVGLDIGTGSAVNAVQHDRVVTVHPDTGQNLEELNVQHWRELLELACACYDMTGLGYLGVDLVLDGRHGPTLLELNARPGLSIQIANGAGLLPRLRKVESMKNVERMSVAERIEYSLTHFSVCKKEKGTAGIDATGKTSPTI